MEEMKSPFPFHQNTGFFPKRESVRKGTWSSGHRDRCLCPKRWLCRTNSTRLFHHRLPLAPVCSAQSSSRAPLRTGVPDETKHFMYCNHQSHTLYLTEREMRRTSLVITNNPSSSVSQAITGSPPKQFLESRTSVLEPVHSSRG